MKHDHSTNAACDLCRNQFSFEFPEHLLEELRSHRIVLFAGAGISTESPSVFPYILRIMKAAMKRATVYFDPKIHKALRIKAAATDRSLSEIVNEAVRVALTEDAEDLEAFDKRANEPNLLFEEVLQDLKNRGQI